MQVTGLHTEPNTHIPGNLGVTKSTDSTLTALVAKFQPSTSANIFHGAAEQPQLQQANRSGGQVPAASAEFQTSIFVFFCTLAVPRANPAVIPSAELLQGVLGLILHPWLSGRSPVTGFPTLREEQDILVPHPRCQGSSEGNADWQQAAFHFSQAPAAFSCS